MFLRTQYLQATRALIGRVLAGLVAAVPPRVLDINTTVRLYTSGPALSINSVFTDFTEPAFTGYAPYVLAAALGPINLPGGVGLHQEVDWVATVAPVAPIAIMGAFLVDTDGATLLAAEQFAAPVPIVVIGDALSYDLILAPRSRWGGEQSAA